MHQIYQFFTAKENSKIFRAEKINAFAKPLANRQADNLLQ